MNSKRPTYHPPLFGSDVRAITYSWKPSPASINKIAELGLDPYTIKNELRAEFIIHCEAHDLRAKNYNPLFVEYAQNHYGQATASPTAVSTTPNHQYAAQSQEIAPFSPQQETAVDSNIMNDDWTPSPNMLEYILSMVCPNKQYIQAQLISFTSHYFGKTHPNWDQQFKKWINQGWNVYQNKNSFKDSNEQGFIDNHTDKNWRDGL